MNTTSTAANPAVAAEIASRLALVSTFNIAAKMTMKTKISPSRITVESIA
jgi:hypothetical protein